jgi:hypothetical protein
MTVFKIDACRVTQPRQEAEFEVQLREGTLKVGDTFVCYDTHHPCEFRVLFASSSASKTSLTCAGWLGFDEQFSGAVVNTTASKRPEGFRYEHSTKPA